MKTNFLLMLFTTLSLCSLSYQSNAADAKAGGSTFGQYCAACHGPQGAGDGPAAAAMNPKPKNLTQNKLSDAELKKVIEKGGTSVGLSTSMPAWGAILKPADIDNIIAFIRSLKK